MNIEIRGASSQASKKGFARKVIDKIKSKTVDHSPERRGFLKTLAAGAAGGTFLTKAGETTLGWLFQKDNVIEDLKTQIVPLLKIGSKEEAKEIINDAITKHSEEGDYERVGRIALLGKELDGEKVSNPELEVPTDSQMQEYRLNRIEELTQNMDEQELNNLIQQISKRLE